MTANAFSEGLANFMQWQNQYLDQIGTLFPGTRPQQNSNPWSNLFGNFGGGSSTQSSASDPFSQNIQQQISLIGQMTQGITDSMEAALTAAQQNGEQWQSAVSKSLGDMQARFSGMKNPALAPMMNCPEQINQAWQQLFNPAGSSNANPWTAMNPFAGHAGFPGMSAGSQPLPGLGPDREKFEKAQRLQSLTLAYMTSMFEFNEQYRDFLVHIVGRLQAKIQDPEISDAQSIPSARALYDLWVDAAEEEYAAITSQDRYQRAYGRMINAMMALRQANTELQDDVLKAMNIPSMRELDSLSERLQRTRRENRDLRAELATIRTELAAVSRAASTRATTARKPATSKRAAVSSKQTAAGQPTTHTRKPPQARKSSQARKPSQAKPPSQAKK